MNFLSELFTFTNKEHFYWFVISMSGLGFSIMIFIVTHFIQKFKHIPKYLSLFFSAYYLGVAIKSYHQVFVLMEANELYSKDCVWFNPLMSLLHLFILISFIYLGKKESKLFD